MNISITTRDPAQIWAISRLGEPPQVRRWLGDFGDEVKPIMLEGEPWHGRPTWCYAYYGVPEWATPDKPAPGIVLVHGGGGTAYPGWVRMWVRRGYAAICVDNCGSLPVPTADNRWLANPEGGPQGWGRIECADEPEREQWTYHAVAAAIRSHSFLRSLPNVDSRNIGATGISWGGFLACILAAADPRLAYSVPVYGCGFNYERPYWIEGHDDAAMLKWGALWDPVVFLPHARCPMLWVDGTNDFAFALSRVRRSAALAPVPHAFSTHLRMVHSHGEPGEGPREILAFADHFARGGADVVRVGECRHANGRVEVPFSANGRAVARAELLWTEDGSEVRWHDRLWQAWEIDGFDASSGLASAPLPGNAFAWVVNLVTDDGLVFSSPYEDLDIGQK